MKITRQEAEAMGLPWPKAQKPPKAKIGAAASVQVPLRGLPVKSLWLTLPWPPTNNLYYRHFRGRTVLSKEGKAYRQAVAEVCLERNAGHVLGRLGVSVFAFPPDERRRDLDNLWKALLDSLQAAGVFRDDSDIDEATIKRRKPVGRAHLVVNVESL